MGDRETAGIEFRDQRLNVAENGLACRGVAIVADGRVAREFLDDVAAVEIVAHQAERPVNVELSAIEADHAGRFLAAMLQRMQAERGMRRRVRRTPDSEDATLLVQLVVIERMCRGHRRAWINPGHLYPDP